MKNLIAIIFFLVLSQPGISQDLKKINAEDLKALITNAEQPTIINFWATFCKPCVEEIPYFVEEVKKNGQVKFILVSLDFKELFPKKIEQFAKKNNFKAELFWLSETNADIFVPIVDNIWSGAIPATLFINPKTGYRKFYEEQLSHEILIEELKKLVK